MSFKVLSIRILLSLHSWWEYFTSIWFGGVKIHTIKNPLMQLSLIFYKTVDKNELKIWTFQSHRLSSFSAIKKTVTGVEEGGGKFVLFLSLFLSVHVNFRYKFNSYISLLIITVNLFFSIALLIFLSAISLFFFL